MAAITFDVVGRTMLAERLKEVMEGITLESIADRVGRDKSTLSRWKNGKREPEKVSDLLALAKALGVSTDYLLGLETVVLRDGASVVAEARPRFGSTPDGFVTLKRRAAQIGAGPGYTDELEEPREYQFAAQWLARLGYLNPEDGDDRLQVYKVAKTYGDSMEPLIRPDAILLADNRPVQVIDPGRVYVLDLPGLTVKYVKHDKKRRELVLWGENRFYPPETYALDERPLHQIVKGRVRWVGQALP